MKHINLALIIAILFVLSVSGCGSSGGDSDVTTTSSSTTSTSISTTTTLNPYYLATAEAESAWIMSAQLDSGAVLVHPHGNHVIPYFSNMALEAVLLVTRDYDAQIKRYLIWYLDNLNEPDNLGIYGTIYDYTWDGTSLTSQDDYDSSDSYAATFLSLLKEYYLKTGDRDFITNNLTEIKLIASAIDATLQADGLTYAKLDYHVKYLMDNSEVWKGYTDYADLLSSIGDSDAVAYQAKADTMQAEIEQQMWNSTNQEYFYYAGDSSTDWSVFYPDASANQWPTIFGLLENNASKQQLLFEKLLTNQPAWVTCTAESSPWASVGLAGVLSGDKTTVLEYDQNLQQTFLVTRAYPWIVSDAGWRIRYLLLLP